MLTRLKRALEPRDGRRVGAHALSDLRLAQPGGVTRRKHLVEQGEFFAIQALIFRADFGVRQRQLPQFLIRCHV